MWITEYFSVIVIPVIVAVIVGNGTLKKVSVFEIFQIGAKKGLWTAAELIPTWIGLLTAIGVLRSSGLLEKITEILQKCFSFTGIPTEIFPVLLVRLFSSSAATGLTLDLFRQYGPDSRIGLLASVFMSCTETVFYTMGVYFEAVKIKKGRYTVKGALIATAVGILATVVLVTYL